MDENIKNVRKFSKNLLACGLVSSFIGLVGLIDAIVVQKEIEKNPIPLPSQFQKIPGSSFSYSLDPRYSWPRAGMELAGTLFFLPIGISCLTLGLSRRNYNDESVYVYDPKN